MKTTVFAAALVMLVGAPLIASASKVIPGTNSSLLAISHATTQQPGETMRALKQTLSPQFIDTFELSEALPHNGLEPNPFNYG